MANRRLKEYLGLASSVVWTAFSEAVVSTKEKALREGRPVTPQLERSADCAHVPAFRGVRRFLMRGATIGGWNGRNTAPDIS
jgi:hypothetical protein